MPGTSPELARFARLGIRREHDLLLHLPLRYEDLTRVVPIGSIRGGTQVQVEGDVVRSEVVARGRRTLHIHLGEDVSAGLTALERALG